MRSVVLSLYAALIGATVGFGSGCAAAPPTSDEGEIEAVDVESPFTSDVATLLDLDFDGEITTSPAATYSASIRAQMFYTVGHFNARGGVTRLNRLQLTNVKATAISGGLVKVTYHAKLPVAWPSKTSLPTAMPLTLPRRVDVAGQQTFLAKYGEKCGEDSHEQSVANFWYHYRPEQSGCVLEAADVIRVTANASVSRENVVAKYPEYHRIWEDGALNVVTIWGKYERGATTESDAGVEAYADFIAGVLHRYPSAVVTPTLVGRATAATPDVTFQMTLADGRPVTIVAMLTDELRSESAAFKTRYNQLSTAADAVFYNGHAGLGSNITALAGMGQFLPNKYQLFFMNGCDTFAYSDDAIFKSRAALNPTTDVAGTKYLDVVYNGMPAYFAHMPDGSFAMLDALTHDSHPKNYTEIFKGVAAVQVAIGLGTEDNEFQTRAPFLNAASRVVFAGNGAVTKAEVDTHVAPNVAPGTYIVSLQHSPVAKTGDADLRVKVDGGSFVRCKSLYKNTNEYCEITLARTSTLTMSVTGDATGVDSAYVLRAFRKI